MSLSTYPDTAALGEPQMSIPPELESRLSDPRVADELTHLLDNLDVVNLAVDSLSGLLANGETIMDNVVASLEDARTTAEAIAPDGAREVKAIDPGKTVTALTQMAVALPDITPALVKAGQSGLFDSIGEPGLAVLVGHLAKASTAATQDPAPVAAGGPFALLKALKDPDVSRGVSFLLTVARHLGRQLEK